MAAKKTAFDKIYATLKTKKEKVALAGALEGIEIEVTHTLDVDTMMEFVSMMVNACVDIEAAEYTPESYDFARYMGIMEYYCNIKLPDDYKKVYRVAIETDLIDQVLPHINTEQLSAIDSMVSARITYLRGILTSTAGTRTTELLNRVALVMENTEKMTEKLSGIDFSGAMENLAKMAYMKPEPAKAESPKVIPLVKQLEKE